MAKFKINAGAEIETATKKEVEEVVRAASINWIGEVSRGDRYKRFSTYGTILGNEVQIGINSTQKIGPEAGFVWSVLRLAISVEASNVDLYINDISTSSLVYPDMPRYFNPAVAEIVLYGGETLIWDVDHTADDGTPVWVTGQIRELPVSLAWRLG